MQLVLKINVWSQLFAVASRHQSYPLAAGEDAHRRDEAALWSRSFIHKNNLTADASLSGPGRTKLRLSPKTAELSNDPDVKTCDLISSAS